MKVNFEFNFEELDNKLTVEELIFSVSSSGKVLL